MLPFSSTEFYILIFIFLCIIWVCKQFISDAKYKYILFGLNTIYILFAYPKPFHLLGLIVYFYVGTMLLSRYLSSERKIWGIFTLLLPMIWIKIPVHGSFYYNTIHDFISMAGLSYASFRVVSYYMDKGPQEKMADPWSYFNFIAFTPTLLIGPIERFNRFKASQDIGFSSIQASSMVEGWNAFLKGLAFKYLLAECVDRYWLNIFPEESTQAFHMFSTMSAYYFYLFFDFAGYSWMALGIGKMMGIQVPINFTNPFLAVNPQDFWRRFHISLGDWLKDYFFTPFYMFLTRKKGLKKFPVLRQNIALFLTFLLMGCWNGITKEYIVSGVLFGVYSMVHNTYVTQCKKSGRDIIFGNAPIVVVENISRILMFIFVSFSLYIFSGRCPWI